MFNETGGVGNHLESLQSNLVQTKNVNSSLRNTENNFHNPNCTTNYLPSLYLYTFTLLYTRILFYLIMYLISYN